MPLQNTFEMLLIAGPDNDGILHVFVMARGLWQIPPGTVSQGTLGLCGIWKRQAF